jgi:hypothetical protein
MRGVAPIAPHIAETEPVALLSDAAFLTYFQEDEVMQLEDAFGYLLVVGIVLTIVLMSISNYRRRKHDADIHFSELTDLHDLPHNE